VYRRVGSQCRRYVHSGRSGLCKAKASSRIVEPDAHRRETPDIARLGAGRSKS
jgi:hypothetical protein